jgi:hypothetical protein
MRAPRTAPADATTGWHRLTAFGLTIDSEWPLSGSRPAPAPATATPNTLSPNTVTRVTRVTPAAIDEAWSADAERLLEYREPGPRGQISFTADRSHEHYRFWARDHGRYLVAADGGAIACERGGAGRALQERFVLAHALPVAAILRGYETLHVSAIAGDSGVAAFAGASGAGKTRLASRLVARGAAFLTDDVLAVQAVGEEVLCHPGPAVMAIRHDDAAMLAEIGGRLGAAAGDTDKAQVAPPRRGEVSPLRAIYHLQWDDAFSISPLDGGERQRVLSLSFVPYLTTPERLLRHLTIAQLVGAGVAQFRLRTPRAEPGDEMLAAVETHMRDAGV